MSQCVTVLKKMAPAFKKNETVLYKVFFEGAPLVNNFKIYQGQPKCFDTTQILTFPALLIKPKMLTYSNFEPPKLLTLHKISSYKYVEPQK